MLENDLHSSPPPKSKIDNILQVYTSYSSETLNQFPY